MSMTKEEAIKWLEETIQDTDTYWESCSEALQKELDEQKEVFLLALTALRPITREQVEKVWKPCKVCNGKTTLYQHTNTTKLFMNTFGKATTLVTECNGCPPYADCCMKGISMNSAFRISYCPECGRPLTDKAVETIMKRMEEIRND